MSIEGPSDYLTEVTNSNPNTITNSNTNTNKRQFRRIAEYGIIKQSPTIHHVDQLTLAMALPVVQDLPEHKETSAASPCYPSNYSTESFHRLGLHPAERSRQERCLPAAAVGNYHRLRGQEEEEQTAHAWVHHQVEDTLG